MSDYVIVHEVPNHGKPDPKDVVAVWRKSAKRQGSHVLSAFKRMNTIGIIETAETLSHLYHYKGHDVGRHKTTIDAKDRIYFQIVYVSKADHREQPAIVKPSKLSRQWWEQQRAQ